MTPYEFLSKHAVTGLHIECDAATIPVGDKTLHFGPDVHATISQAGQKFRIDFTGRVPEVDVGFGISAPIRLEVSPAGVDAVGSRFGITKRQRLVMQEVP